MDIFFKKKKGKERQKEAAQRLYQCVFLREEGSPDCHLDKLFYLRETKSNR